MWQETITNPNEAKKNRKRKKKHEKTANYFPTNMPVAHTTKRGLGWVGRLIKRKK